MKENKYLWLIPLGIFLWPFVYLHSFIFPVNGHYRAISNDFINYYYNYKLYLLDNLANFKLPLWSPAEACGYPFYLDPLAQVFYPFNIPLTLFYKIAGGYTALDHQIFTVFGVAIFALGLFKWLRLLNTNLRAVVFATIVISISFKMTEILRFPNAVHSAAWYPWVLYCLTRIVFMRSIKDVVGSGALLCFALFCLCTAGYPYYIYYSIFLFIPYISVFFIKQLRVQLIGAEQIHWKRVIPAFIFIGLAAAMVCLPYLFAIKHLMEQTANRSGTNYEFSISYPFTFEDSVGSLVYPPAAQMEGWYFFSICGLILIMLYLLRDKSQLWWKLFLVIWVAIISYISYGKDSYLFKLLWNYMPGFSNLRVWGRLNIILVPIIAWALSLAYASFEAIVSGTKIYKKQQGKWRPLAVIIFAYGIILATQLYFYQNKICDKYWTYFPQISSNDILFIYYGIAAFVVIFLFLTISRWTSLCTPAVLNIILIGLIIMSIIEIGHTGTRIWTVENEQKQKRVCLDVAKINQASFFYPRVEKNASMIAIDPAFNVGIIENWYFDRYMRFLKNTRNERNERYILLGEKDARRIFFSKSIGYSTIRGFLLDASQYPQKGRLISYTGDELLWEAEVPTAGYISFIDNWDENWKAFIDDKPTKIELLFGTFKSVCVPAGLHRVKFSYQPSIFNHENLP
jgi:hypothetical protein